MIDEKIERGGYIMTKPFGACLVLRRYIRTTEKGAASLWYHVSSSSKNNGTFHVPQTLCTRRATEQEYKRTT